MEENYKKIQKEKYKQMPKIPKYLRQRIKKAHYPLSAEDLQFFASYFLSKPLEQDTDKALTKFWTELSTSPHTFSVFNKQKISNIVLWLYYPMKQHIPDLVVKALELYVSDLVFDRAGILKENWKVVVQVLTLRDFPLNMKETLLKEIKKCVLVHPKKDLDNTIINGLTLPERVDITTKNLGYKRMRVVNAIFQNPDVTDETLLVLLDEPFSPKNAVDFLLSNNFSEDSFQALHSVINSGNLENKLELFNIVCPMLLDQLYTKKDHMSTNIINFIFKFSIDVLDKAGENPIEINFERFWDTQGEFAYLNRFCNLYSPEEVTSLEGFYSPKVINHIRDADELLFCHILRSPAIFSYVVDSMNIAEYFMERLEKYIRAGILQTLLNKMTFLCKNNTLFSEKLALGGLCRCNFLKNLLYDNDISRFVLKLLLAMARNQLALKIMLQEDTLDVLKFIDQSKDYLWEPVKRKYVRLKDRLESYSKKSQEESQHSVQMSLSEKPKKKKKKSKATLSKKLHNEQFRHVHKKR